MGGPFVSGVGVGRLLKTLGWWWAARLRLQGKLFGGLGLVLVDVLLCMHKYVCAGCCCFVFAYFCVKDLVVV